jgi:hypothetical protein
MRWGWRLNVLYTAAWQARNLWADPRRLESLLLSVSSANRQVRVFGAIILPQPTRQVAVGKPQLPLQMTNLSTAAAETFAGRLRVRFS